MKKILKIIIFCILFIPTTHTYASSNNPINAVIQITCVSNQFDMIQGSGIIVSPDGKIITNAHVVASDPYKLWGCFGGMISKENLYKPDKFFNIKFFYSNITNDLAFGEIDGSLDGYDQYLFSSDILSSYPYLKLNFNTAIGEEVRAFGYPDIAEGNLNITKGSITSKPMVGDYKYLFSDVSASYGNSGGALVNKNNELLGIVTAVNSSSLAQNTYILDVNSLYIEKDWLNKVKNANDNSFDTWTSGINFINEILNTDNGIDYQNILSGTEEHTNYSTTLSQYDLACKSLYGEGSRYYEVENNSMNSSCYCINNFEWNSDRTKCIAINMNENFVETEKSLLKTFDSALSNRLSGRILLQIENNGEAWYVNPDNKKRYYLGRPNDAFSIMRELGLGISNNNFNAFNGYAPKRLSGKILLKVEGNGEAYYVNPNDLKMHYLGRPADAFEIMRNLGLGITNENIRKIDIN